MSPQAQTNQIGDTTPTPMPRPGGYLELWWGEHEAEVVEATLDRALAKAAVGKAR